MGFSQFTGKITLLVLIIFMFSLSNCKDREVGHSIKKYDNINLYIPEEEDEVYLEQILKIIFPQDTTNSSDEDKAIEILRYVTSTLLLKRNNNDSATKVLKEGYAICGGMSHAFKILCRKAGIPARYIGLFHWPLGDSHAASEVFYNDRWHFFDPTYGFFFYSDKEYDGKGAIVSFSALVSDPNRWFPFKVVDKPWVGEYNIRQGINVVEDDYLKNIYGSSLINLYRSHLKSVFPVAYGENYSISYPVDADIVKNKSHWFGVIDNSYTDLYTYRENLSGYGYLKKEHSGTNFPPLYHTWVIKSMKNCIVHIEYYSVTDKTPKLELIPLRAAHLIETNCDDKKTTFTVLINDILGILSVKSTKGTFLVDAMHIFKE